MQPNLHLVTSHPFEQSFNFALRRLAAEEFDRSGWTMSVSDLYQQGFNPSLGAEDCLYPSQDSYQGVAPLQSMALEKQALSSDIAAEQQKLIDAELVILQFPLWWGSMPAMLKGWVDRVLIRGFAYGGQFELANKSLLLSVTTGGAANKQEEAYYLDKITGLSGDIFSYMKMDCLEPFICHGPASIGPEQRAAELSRYQEKLRAEIASF